MWMRHVTLRSGQPIKMCTQVLNVCLHIISRADAGATSLLKTAVFSLSLSLTKSCNWSFIQQKHLLNAFRMQTIPLTGLDAKHFLKEPMHREFSGHTEKVIQVFFYYKGTWGGDICEQCIQWIEREDAVGFQGDSLCNWGTLVPQIGLDWKTFLTCVKCKMKLSYTLIKVNSCQTSFTEGVCIWRCVNKYLNIKIYLPEIWNQF